MPSNHYYLRGSYIASLWFTCVILNSSYLLLVFLYLILQYNTTPVATIRLITNKQVKPTVQKNQSFDDIMVTLVVVSSFNSVLFLFPVWLLSMKIIAWLFWISASIIPYLIESSIHPVRLTQPLSAKYYSYFKFAFMLWHVKFFSNLPYWVLKYSR